MPKVPKLSDAECGAALRDLPSWEIRDLKLHREYVFPDFVHAFGFMATSAIQPEAGHHRLDGANV